MLIPGMPGPGDLWGAPPEDPKCADDPRPCSVACSGLACSICKLPTWPHDINELGVCWECEERQNHEDAEGDE